VVVVAVEAIEGIVVTTMAGIIIIIIILILIATSASALAFTV
jgi:hypothetical protein